MNNVEQEVRALVQKELDFANKNFPLFVSQHEGYAVIKEEAEELSDEVLRLDGSIAALWGTIKDNWLEKQQFITNNIHKAAIAVATEAIQVAAMAVKYQISLLKEEQMNGNSNRTTHTEPRDIRYSAPEHVGTKQK